MIEVYSDKAGFEVGPGEKPDKGSVRWRFFLLEAPRDGKTTQARFIMEPHEAFKAALLIDKIARTGGKERITHKFKGNDGEVTSDLVIEKWERGNKGGYAFAYSRGKDVFINVPVEAHVFLWLAAYLRQLSFQEAWVVK